MIAPMVVLALLRHCRLLIALSLLYCIVSGYYDEAVHFVFMYSMYVRVFCQERIEVSS